MVRANHVGEREGESDGLENLDSNARMDAHLLGLLASEGARLAQNMLGYGELADVVQERSSLERLELRIGDPHVAAQLHRVGLHAPDVSLRRSILGVDGERQ